MAATESIQPAVKSGIETANHLEAAVRADDRKAYRHAMDEVTKFRSTATPEQMKAFTSAVTHKLEEDKVLPRVALFEAKGDFDKMSLNENRRVKKNEIDLFQHRDDVNPVQAKLLDTIKGDYDKIRDYNRENMGLWNSDQISRRDIDAGLKMEKEADDKRQGVSHLFKKDANGQSLLDKWSDNAKVTGKTLDSIARLDQDQPKIQNLSAEDRNSLKQLQKFVADSNGAVTTEQIKKWAKDNGVNIDNFAKPDAKPADAPNGKADGKAEVKPVETKPEAKPEPKPTETKPEEKKDPHKAEMEQKQQKDALEAAQKRAHAHAEMEKFHKDINDALTVKPHQSYAHCAEALLKLAGHNPTAKDIRELSHQLWVADGHRKAGTLKAGQQLNVSDEIRHNPALAGIHKKYKELRDAEAGQPISI